MDYKTTLISVIMPVYNGEKYIDEAICSMLAQTYPHWELIITDDGSTDNTVTAIERYLSDKRICLLKGQHSGSAKIARDNSIEHAHGEWIISLDADDYLEPEYIEKMVSALNDTGAGLVACQMNAFDGNGEVLRKLPSDSDCGITYSGHQAFSLTIGTWKIGLNGCLRRREDYLQANQLMINNLSALMNADEVIERLVLDKQNIVHITDAKYYIRRTVPTTTSVFSIRLFDNLESDDFLRSYILKNYYGEKELRVQIHAQIFYHLFNLMYGLYKHPEVYNREDFNIDRISELLIRNYNLLSEYSLFFVVDKFKYILLKIFITGIYLRKIDKKRRIWAVYGKILNIVTRLKNM